jgi:hypothetical protein
MSIQLFPLAVSNVGIESRSFSTTRLAAPTRSMICRPLTSSSSPPNAGCLPLRSPAMMVGFPFLLARSSSNTVRVPSNGPFGGTYTLKNAPCTLDDHRPGGGPCELRLLDRPPSGLDQRSDLVGAAPAVLGPSDPRRHAAVRLLNEDHIRLLLLRRLL